MGREGSFSRTLSACSQLGSTSDRHAYDLEWRGCGGLEASASYATAHLAGTRNDGEATGGYCSRHCGPTAALISCGAFLALLDRSHLRLVVGQGGEVGGGQGTDDTVEDSVRFLLHLVRGSIRDGVLNQDGSDVLQTKGL